MNGQGLVPAAFVDAGSVLPVSLALAVLVLTDEGAVEAEEAGGWVVEQHDQVIAFLTAESDDDVVPLRERSFKAGCKWVPVEHRHKQPHVLAAKRLAGKHYARHGQPSARRSDSGVVALEGAAHGPGSGVVRNSATPEGKRRVTRSSIASLFFRPYLAQWLRHGSRREEELCRGAFHPTGLTPRICRRLSHGACRRNVSSCQRPCASSSSCRAHSR